MTKEQTIRVLEKYSERVHLSADKCPTDLTHPGMMVSLRHIAWMCREAIQLVKDGSMDRANRWLGFIQGVLWAEGYYSIEQMEEDNKPEEENGEPRITQGGV